MGFRCEALGGQRQAGRRRTVDQRESEVCAVPAAVVRRLLVLMRSSVAVISGCGLRLVRMDQAGAVSGVVCARRELAAVRVVVPVRRQVRRGRELNREQEEDEQHRRRVLAQFTQSDAAVRHACLNTIAAGVFPIKTSVGQPPRGRPPDVFTARRSFQAPARRARAPRAPWHRLSRFRLRYHR